MSRPASAPCESVDLDGITFRLYGGRTYFTGWDRNRKRSVALHRYVYEKHHGPIPAGWHVHHIDGNARNNDPANLAAVDPHHHIAEHWVERDATRAVRCDYCGREYVAGRSWGKLSWCSSACRDKDRRQRATYGEARTCRVCGNEFTVNDRRDIGTTCSRPCAEKGREFIRPCDDCGTDFAARRPWARFCSGACKQRHAKRT